MWGPGCRVEGEGQGDILAPSWCKVPSRRAEGRGWRVGPGGEGGGGGEGGEQGGLHGLEGGGGDEGARDGLILGPRGPLVLGPLYVLPL